MSTEKKSVLLESSEEAEYVLDKIIEDTDEENIAEIANQESIKNALKQKRILESAVSNRELSRVLIVTSDMAILDETSLTHSFYLSLSAYFSEIHIIVTASLRQSKKKVERYGENVWVYTTGQTSWYKTPFTVRAVAHEQLVFTGGFRADFVVASDPFESGLGAYFVANKFRRPFQLHVQLPFWLQGFNQKEKQNKWRSRIAKYLLKRAESVRVATNEQQTYITKSYPHIEDVAMLPRHYDIQSLMRLAEKEQQVDLFPQYAFVLLFVGKLGHKSTLFRAIDAVRNLLKTPSIALVVIGDGPAKQEFIKRTEILGINKQVIFKSETEDVMHHMQSSDILICTDTDELSEETVIKAAAVGLPLMLAKTQLREDLFTDGESAFLSDPTDTIDFMQKLGKFLSANQLRTQFSDAAQMIVRDRLHEDPEVFRRAYRDSLEGVFTSVESEPVAQSKEDVEEVFTVPQP